MKKKYKILLIISLILVIFLVGVILIFNKKDKIILKSNEFVFEYGEKVCADIKCYMEDADSTKNINEYKLDIGKLTIKDNSLISNDSDYLEIGEYYLTIKYKKNSENFKIIVKDAISPEFVDYKDVITLEQNSNGVDINTFFKATDLTDVSIDIDGKYDLTTLGEYKVKVIASDKSKNKMTRDLTIKVVDLEEAKKDGIISKNLDDKIYKSAAMIEYEKKQEEQKSISQKSSSEKKTSSSNSIQNKNSSSNSNGSNNTASSSYRKDISDSYVAQINAYRSSQGLSVLPVTSEAQAEADRRAKEIVTNPSHDGSSYGFGENIGGGGIGTNFFELWMNSHAHYNAIIREQNVAIAASVYETNGMWYAVVVFRMNY